MFLYFWIFLEKIYIKYGKNHPNITKLLHTFASKVHENINQSAKVEQNAENTEHFIKFLKSVCIFNLRHAPLDRVKESNNYKNANKIQKLNHWKTQNVAIFERLWVWII